MFKSPSLFLSDSIFLKIVLQGQHWEAFVPDTGALSTITACRRCTHSNKKHRCATAARLEVHLGAPFQPSKRREAISEALTPDVVASCQCYCHKYKCNNDKNSEGWNALGNATFSGLHVDMDENVQRILVPDRTR